MEELIDLLIYSVPATLITITLHEFAHGYVSYRLGDDTPKWEGRLTLNPFKHLDLIGTICLAIFHFGWAKPVCVNPNAYKNPRLGIALTSLAGPLTNFLITFLAMFGIGLISKTGTYTSSSVLINYLYILCYYLAMLSTGLGIFNLLPFPPLDGSKVLGAFLPQKISDQLEKYSNFGMLILFVLLYMNLLDTPLEWLNQAIIDGIFSVVKMILNL